MPVRRAFSTRADGDFHIGTAGVELDARRAALAPGSWTWLRQVHGRDVVVVDHPGAGAGADADAAVTATPGAVLAVHTADCAPVLMADADAGVIGAAHAGWRGLHAGVLEATADAMTALGATAIHAVVGPHIRGRCYEFGGDDLALVADRLGDDVRASTAWGTPGLDMIAGIRTALAGRATVETVPGCTACEPDRYFSHRARVDPERHVNVVWLDADHRGQSGHSAETRARG